jgi:cyclic beta-1,2-glucan synthetase
MINPIEHTRTKDEVKKYKIEPYAVAGDVYSVGNLAGRGGWSWYTGSSSWMYKVGIESILGLKVEENELKIEPHIPENWNEYSIRYRYGQSLYNIKIKNPNGKTSGVEKMLINGREVQEKKVKLDGTGTTYEVEIEM